MFSPSSLVILSEAALALYPILIKTVPVNLTTQLLARFLTFVVCAGVLAPTGSLGSLWSPGALPRTLGLGGITLVHVFTSYYAFLSLPAGVAMSLFYTYPVFNLLGGWLGYGERISLTQGLLVLVAIAGVVLLSMGTREEVENPSIEWKGILAGLGAAVTETLMYFAVRTAKQTNPYFSTLELYSGALAGMIGLVAAGKLGGVEALKLESGSTNWIKMLAFNSFIGFAGYALRFFTIPQMSTLAFSMLSLVGVIASFVFGLAFVSEVPNALSLSGAALISLAAAFTDKQ
jgi:drug/metabolite transporter (DMT)-like permease